MAKDWEVAEMLGWMSAWKTNYKRDSSLVNPWTCLSHFGRFWPEKDTYWKPSAEKRGFEDGIGTKPLPPLPLPHTSVPAGWWPEGASYFVSSELAADICISNHTILPSSDLFMEQCIQNAPRMCLSHQTTIAVHCQEEEWRYLKILWRWCWKWWWWP